MRIDRGVLDGVMVSKLDEQSFMSEFESHWVPNSYDLVSHLSKKLSKLLNLMRWWYAGEYGAPISLPLLPSPL